MPVPARTARVPGPEALPEVRAKVGSLSSDLCAEPESEGPVSSHRGSIRRDSTMGLSRGGRFRYMAGRRAKRKALGQFPRTSSNPPFPLYRFSYAESSPSQGHDLQSFSPS